MEGDFIKINKWLLPLSWLYGLAVRVRNALFDVGLLKSESFDVPVISVGNITVGGTGKTPHVEYLVELLRTRHSFLRVVRLRKSKLAPLFYINALDMMYIWMRQPQAVAAMRRIMAALSPEERLIFLKAQELLSRERSISKLFLSGLVGQNFGRALAFYLHCYRAYLEELRQFRLPDEAEEE